MSSHLGDDRGEVERILGDSKLAKPTPRRGRGGQWRRDPGAEWDWFYGLPGDVRAYISRHYMDRQGVRPDVVADWHAGDVDQVMAELVAAVQRIRRARESLDYLSDAEYWEDVAAEEDRDPLDLVGPDEVAAMLAVKRNTIAQWRHRGYLPTADLLLSGLSIWHRSTIEQWARETGREIVGNDDATP